MTDLDHPTSDPTNPLHRLARDLEGGALTYDMQDDIRYVLDRLAAETARADRAENIAKAAEGRAADYRTVAINQGWNWRMCDAYGREEYAEHRGEHVDACALNAAEHRARAALAGASDDH